MFRRVFLLLLLSLLVLLLAPVAVAQTTEPTGYLPQETPIRSGPTRLAPQYTVTFAAGTTVNVIARNYETTWYFVRRTGNALAEGWIEAQYLVRNDDIVPQGTAAGNVINQPLNLYLQPNSANSPVRTLSVGTEVVVSGKDSSGTWFFLQRPDGAFNWAPASGVTLTVGNPVGIPIWYTVPSVPYTDSGDGSTGQLYLGTTISSANMVVRIYGQGQQQIVATLPAGQNVSVIAFTNVDNGYYLVQLDTGLLGWIAEASLSVNAQVPEI
jgi:uncharacterized protein YgiM (DUF1202 family)